MIILFDTNVVVDVLLDRRPYAPTAAALMASVERGRLTGLLAATTVTTIYYLTAKGLGHRAARAQVSKLLSLFDVAPVGGPVLDAALKLSFADFEDAVVHEAARLSGADGIVTRNEQDFAHASLRVYSPRALRTMLAALPPGS